MNPSLNLPFISKHETILELVSLDGQPPADYSQRWTRLIIMVSQKAPRQDPDTFHMVSPAELKDISPRLHKRVYEVNPNGAAYITPKLRARSYGIPVNSPHSLRDTARQIRIFALVAAGEN